MFYNYVLQLCFTNFEAMQHIPNMHDFLKKSHGQILFKLHIITGISLIITLIDASFYLLFGLLLLVELSLLLTIMVKVIFSYRRCFAKIKALEN